MVESIQSFSGQTGEGNSNSGTSKMELNINAMLDSVRVTFQNCLCWNYLQVYTSEQRS